MYMRYIKKAFAGNLHGQADASLELIDLVFGTEEEVTELRRLSCEDQLTLCRKSDHFSRDIFSI